MQQERPSAIRPWETRKPQMFNYHPEEIEWGGRKLVLETGKIARQSDGAVMATYGETVVLATAVGETEPKPGIDFFTLTVNSQEKFYASGKIPGGDRGRCSDGGVRGEGTVRRGNARRGDVWSSRDAKGDQRHHSACRARGQRTA